jgi:[protein-PII] uridylyltransferase
MRRFARTLSNIAKRLKAENRFNFSDRTAAYLVAINTENRWLEMQELNGRSGLAGGRARAEMLDDFLCHLMEEAAAQISKPPVIAFVALGGYGRSELNPRSDIDITWIHAGGAKFPAGFVEIVKEVYNLMVACNFDPSHSTRSLNETIAEANSEMKSRTAMLEARLIWGSNDLFKKFRKRFVKECVEGHEAAYLKARVANQADRHAQNGQTVYMQEPNLKNGCGGLRDYQNLLWMAYFKHRIMTTEELVKAKYLNDTEKRELDRAYEFIFRMRNHLHYLTGLHTDKIFVSQQLELANRMGYKEKHPDVLRRTEALMRDYYGQARNIYEITELLCERMTLPMPEPPKPPGIFKRLIFRPRPKTEREEFDGFIAIGNRLYYRDRQIFSEDRQRMMRLFRHVQQRGLSISPELRQLVRRRLKYVDNTFRYAKANREVFFEILRRKGQVGAILRAMHRVDFLGRWMPEFGRVTALVQHEFYHRYTVDEHTLVCIEKLDSLLDIEDPRFARHHELFNKMEDAFVLYLAILLHDTGKAENKRAHAVQSTLSAERVWRRLQLKREERRLLLFLVDNHELLSRTARQRDPYDPATIEYLAGIIINRPNLEALMLLTAADGLGVGNEKMWNDWIQSLVGLLYEQVGQYLDDSEGYRRRRQVERDEFRKEVAALLPKDLDLELDGHFTRMPERYFALHAGKAAQVAGHVQMFREFLETRWNSDDNPLSPVVRWMPQPNAGHSVLLVVTWDRRQLLERICGALSATELSILHADIFTRDDGLVLDKFRVCTAKYKAVEDKRDIKNVEKLLNAALQAEEYNFHPLLAKAYAHALKREQTLQFAPRVIVNNAPERHTVIEIVAPDRLGLLYDLVATIGRLGFDIAYARITTEAAAAIDTFHITLPEARKITDEKRLGVLRDALIEVGSNRPWKT